MKLTDILCEASNPYCTLIEYYAERFSGVLKKCFTYWKTGIQYSKETLIKVCAGNRV